MTSAPIECLCQRTFSGELPAWLLTLCVGAAFAANPGLSYPQARAVVDDFGTLVVVEGWQ